MSDILSLPRGRGFTEDDVRRVVSTNEKQRFAIREEGTELLLIRANQGHSMEVGVALLRMVHTPSPILGEWFGIETTPECSGGRVCCTWNEITGMGPDPTPGMEEWRYVGMKNGIPTGAESYEEESHTLCSRVAWRQWSN